MSLGSRTGKPSARRPDVHWLGVYVGIAILVSLRLPARVYGPDGLVHPVTPVMRVGVGLVWPFYYVFNFIARRL